MDPQATQTGREQEGGEIRHLSALAYRHAWLEEELPWDEGAPWNEGTMPDALSLLARLPAFRAMTPDERAVLKRSEFASHLSALADGEKRATRLAAETALLADPDDADGQTFLGTLLADEAKHFAVLRRFVEEKLGHPVTPHPWLGRVFDALSAEHDYALNLLVGQVVLEGAAASLLNSLLVATRPSLLRELLRRISRDEARHMRYAYVVSALRSEHLSRSRRHRMEELLFASACAAAASLVAEPTWEELNLPRAEARETTVDALKARGVFNWYTRVVTRQLDRLGFPGDGFTRTVERHLEERLRRGELP